MTPGRMLPPLTCGCATCSAGVNVRVSFTPLIVVLFDTCRPPTPTSLRLVRDAVQEVRHNNLSLFRRLKQLLKEDARVFIFFANEHHCETFPGEIKGESPNDRNDRAIRIATSW